MNDSTFLPFGSPGEPTWKVEISEAEVGEIEPVTPPPLPNSIGRYRILRLLGEGGMGAVYEAEQEQPRRVVALKVIKPGAFSPELLRRFEREAQVLGRLQSPGVAQVYEAGTADTGFGIQPYFAMEFIRGESLGDYVAQHHLNTRQRLGLMLKVCEAVEHAHQRGIIHRDLKPGNILVDASGQSKILDFGVARVADDDAHVTRQTDYGQLVGTVAYMSPEQVLADPLEVDTRTDVYSLGVILYELLAGQLPYTLSKKLHEAVRTIREEDPVPLGAINRAYGGDIETIVAKALEKDKGRRYGSAAALADDLKRCLQDEPIAARPPSATYQLVKFARRHRTLVAAIAAVGLVLLTGIIGTTWQAMRAFRAGQVAMKAEQTTRIERDRALHAEATAQDQRDRAVASERQADKERNQAVAERKRANDESAAAKAINDFLENDLLAQAGASSQAHPDVKPDPDLRVRTALDRAAQRISSRFDRQPRVEASIRQTIAKAYTDLGLYAESQQQLERAVELWRRANGEEDPETLGALSDLAESYRAQGNYSQAEIIHSKVLAIRRRTLGDEHPVTLDSMAGLAALYQKQGKYDQAEMLSMKVLAGFRHNFGEQNIYTLRMMNILAELYMAQRKLSKAEPLLRKLTEIQPRVLGDEHPETLLSMVGLGQLYDELGRYAESEPLLTKALAVQRRILGEEHPYTLATMNVLARSYQHRHSYEQAEPLLRKVLEIDRRTQGEQNPTTLSHMNNLAALYEEQGKYEQAEPLLTAALDSQRRNLGDQHPETLTSMNNLGMLYRLRGQFTRAELLLSAVLETNRQNLGEENQATVVSMVNLAGVYRSQGKLDSAEALYTRAYEVQRRLFGDDDRVALLIIYNLGVLHQSQRRYPQAETCFTKVLEARRRLLGPQHPDTALMMLSLGEVWLQQLKYVDAEKQLREALTAYEKAAPDNWRRYDAEALLGASLRGIRDYAGAEPLLISGYQGMVVRKALIPAENRLAFEEAGQRIVELYQGWGKVDSAEAWRQKVRAAMFSESRADH